MTLQECYKEMNGDYEETFSRLGSDAFIKKLMVKFLSDDNLQKLQDAYKNGDGATAFMAVHTLKGVALNMGFTPLAKCCSDLTEKLRGNNILEGTDDLLAQVEKEYARTKEIVGKLDA